MGGVSGMDYWHKLHHRTALTDEYERKEERNGKDAG